MNVEQDTMTNRELGRMSLMILDVGIRCIVSAIIKYGIDVLIPPMLYILLSRNTFTIIYLTNKAGNAIP